LFHVFEKLDNCFARVAIAPVHEAVSRFRTSVDTLFNQWTELRPACVTVFRGSIDGSLRIVFQLANKRAFTQHNGPVIVFEQIV
jgi:hypothetical protein